MESGIPIFLDTPRGTLAFNASAYGAGVPQFRLDSDGFSFGAALRVVDDDDPGRDGSLLSGGFSKGASVTLRGSIRAASNADRALALDMLRGYVLSIRRVDGLLRWTPTGMSERRLPVRAWVDPLDGGSLVKTFSVGLMSAQPVAEASVLKSADTSSLTTTYSNGVEFPAEFPVNMGDASHAGEVVVTNGGDSDAFATVKVFGAIQAPIVRLLETGEFVSLPGLTLHSGDFAEIDMRAETVTLNGADTYSLVQFLDVSSSVFWALPPGPSTVQLTGASPDANAKATILFRDTFA